MYTLHLQAVTHTGRGMWLACVPGHQLIVAMAVAESRTLNCLYGT